MEELLGREGHLGGGTRHETKVPITVRVNFDKILLRRGKM